MGRCYTLLFKPIFPATFLAVYEKDDFSLEIREVLQLPRLKRAPNYLRLLDATEQSDKPFKTFIKQVSRIIEL